MADTEWNGARRGQGQGSTRPLRTAGVVLYATLALLILTIPQSLPNWLRDMEESLLQQAALSVASGAQAAAQAAGVDVPYRWARATFHAWTGKDD